MIDPIREMKTRAEILERRASHGDTAALARLVSLPELRGADAAKLANAASAMTRKHWLAVVAREAGFKSWEHASRVLCGDPNERDLGRLLYPDRFSAHLNIWFTDHAEARAAFEQTSGYLLAY